MLWYNLFQRWRVFIEVPEIIVLVPALLGLKGNLEMTLASRLSTEANLGNMDDSKEQWSMITANLILVQVSLIILILYLKWIQFILSSLALKTVRLLPSQFALLLYPSVSLLVRKCKPTILWRQAVEWKE